MSEFKPWFVAEDGNGDLAVWRELGGGALPVLYRRNCDASFWDVIVGRITRGEW